MASCSHSLSNNLKFEIEYSLPHFTKVARKFDFLQRVASYSHTMLMYLKFRNGYSLPYFTEVARNCNILPRVAICRSTLKLGLATDATFYWYGKKLPLSRVARYTHYVSNYMKFGTNYCLPLFIEVARNCDYLRRMASYSHFLRRVASYSNYVLIYLKFGTGYCFQLFIEVARNCHFLPRVASYTRGDKVSPNSFTHPNPLTLIEPKLTQLLVGLNGH